jgi:hypothetical protein
VSNTNPIEHLFQEELYQIGPRVLVIIPAEWNTLAEADQLVLTKMLAATKQSMASVQVLVLEEVDISNIDIFRPSRIIALGSTLTSSGKPIPTYAAYRAGDIWAVQADRLNQLDDAKKKILWNALREMFQV